MTQRNRNSAATSAISDAQAWRRGADLAIELLSEIEDRRQDDTFVLDARLRGRKPQDNIVLRYFNRARDSNDSRCVEAFCAVLTDFVASSRQGGIPDTESLERLSRRRTAINAQ